MTSAHVSMSPADLTPAQESGIIHTEDLTKVYPGTDFAAVDQLNLDVRAGEIFGLLGPNGAGKTTTAGMLTTRVVPTSGRAFLAGVDVGGAPGAGQAAERDRLAAEHPGPAAHRLGEPVLPRTAVRHGGQGVQADRRRPARAVPAVQVGQGVGVRAVGRHGPAAHGGAGDLPPAVGAVPRRADRGTGPAEPAGAVGPARRAAPRRPDHPAHHALHGRGGPALRPGRDHGPRPDPGARHPGRAQAGIGADTIVTVRTTGDPDRLGELLAARWRASPGPGRRTAGSSCTCRAATGWSRASCLPPSAAGSSCIDVSVAEPSLETVFINLTGRELRD